MNKVLEYARLLYSTGRYEEASSLLLGFLKLVPQNEKNLSKITLALSMLLSINVLVKNFSGIKENILAIKGYIEKLKEAVDEEIKKTNFESVTDFI